MKAPSPPPTMPSRIRRPALPAEFFASIVMAAPALQAQHPPGLLRIGLAAGEVVERLLGDADDVPLMNSAPSAAPASGCFRQHSHSSTAQLS